MLGQGQDPDLPGWRFGSKGDPSLMIGAPVDYFFTTFQVGALNNIYLYNCYIFISAPVSCES